MPEAALKVDDVAGRMDGVVRVIPDGSGRAEAYLPSPAVQNHAANLIALDGGNLACVWFGGTMEGTSDISIYISRLARGAKRWSTPQKLSDDPTRSEQNPLLFQAPDGRVSLFHTAQNAGRQDTAVIRCRISDDGGATFRPAGDLDGDPGAFVRQPIVVNGRGEWLMPTFLCRSRPDETWVGDDDISAVMISADQGRTWTSHLVPESLGCVHMNIVPLDGENLVAVYRSRWADHIYLSRSFDGGHSWTAPEATGLPNNNSSIQMIRLKSGRLALVYNHSSAANAAERRVSLYDDLGSESERSAPDKTANQPAKRTAFWGSPRAPLSIVLSEDEGRSWRNRVDLEIGDGYCMTNNSEARLNRELSYPSICQSEVGAIHVAFTYFRQAIKYLRLSEDWLLTRS